MPALELPENLGFAHAGGAVNQETGHAIARGIGEQRVEPIYGRLRLVESDPAVRLNPGDPVRFGQRGVAAEGGLQMGKVLVRVHDHSSTGKMGYLRKSVGVSSSGWRGGVSR